MSSNENISIEGVSFGSFGFNSVEAYDIASSNFNTYKFNLEFLFDAGVTTSLLLDNILDVAIDFGAGVNPDCGWSNTNVCITNSGASPFATINYTYSNSNSTNVPEPTTLAIFALGIIGLASRRFKKQ